MRISPAATFLIFAFVATGLGLFLMYLPAILQKSVRVDQTNGYSSSLMLIDSQCVGVVKDLRIIDSTYVYLVDLSIPTSEAGTVQSISFCKRSVMTPQQKALFSMNVGDRLTKEKSTTEMRYLKDGAWIEAEIMACEPKYDVPVFDQ